MSRPTFDLTDAACLRPGIDPDLFFDIGEHGRPTAERREAAKAVCRPCPVRAECLAWAFEVGDRWSVLGGTTAAERLAAGAPPAAVPTGWRDCTNPTCIGEFYSADPDQRHCSTRCRDAHDARLRREQRTCANPECRQQFLPERANNTCCTTRCSNRATYLKRVGERVAA
jgi:WhiB family redox-sensing transcriptional regulator